MVTKVNSRGKITDSPNRNTRLPKVSPVYLNPWTVGSVLAAVSVGLVFGAEPVFAHSTPDSFGRKIAEFMLQLALIGIIGVLIDFSLKGYSDRRALLDQDNAKRLGLLRRTRAVHVAVAYAQRLIRVDNSGQTYSEQLRKLMTLIYELEDIQADVDMAKKRKLFKPFDDTIIEGIKGIIKFLECLTNEYRECRSDVEADAEFNKDFRATVRKKHTMRRIEEFIDAFPDFPALYQDSVDMSKGKMREKIYGLRR
jgi:hypothetical protein